MAFEVEDGTGIEEANALRSLEDVDAFLADRGFTAWALKTDEAREQAIIIASEFLSSALSWKGYKLREEQGLALPRSTTLFRELGAEYYSPPTDTEIFSQPEITAAVARVALAVGVNGVNLFAHVTGAQGVESVKAGSVQVNFAARGVSLAMAGRPDFPWLYGLLQDYLDGGSSVNRKVLRA